METLRMTYEGYWGYYWRVTFRHAIPGIREWDAKLVDLIIQECALPPGASVLDLGCAGGDQARLFARRGYRVVGIDKVPRLIEFAQTAFRAEGLPGEFIVADMRLLDYRDSFDLCVMLSGTFGSPTDEEDQGILRTIHAALKPGGLAFINYLPLETFCKKVRARTWDRMPGGYALCEEWFDVPTSTYRTVHTHVLFDGRIIEAAEQDGHGANEIIRCYGAREAESVAKACGFAVRAHLPSALIGNPDHVAQDGDPRGILILRKSP